jgi:hypothetical protein
VSEEKRGRRRGNIALLAILALIFLGIYGGNSAQNVRAQRRVRAACATIRAGEKRYLENDAVRFVFGGHFDELARDLEDELDAQCGYLDARLSWWRWNVGAYVTLPVDEPRRARKREAFAEAERRCPVVLRTSLEALKIQDKEIASTSGQVCSLLTLARQKNEIPSKPVLAWEWPGVLEPLAKALTPSS